MNMNSVPGDEREFWGQVMNVNSGSGHEREFGIQCQVMNMNSVPGDERDDVTFMS